jgi:hypothetical protein
VADFEVKCQRLHVPHRYAPVGPLSPRAVFLRLIACMATVAVVRLAKGIFEQSDMPISPRLIALGRLTSCPVRRFAPNSAQPAEEPEGFTYDRR